MYAIVEIGGKQLKVQKNDTLYVNQLPEKEGSQVEFDNILLLDDNGKVTVGKPHVEKAKVKAKVLQHLQDEKVTVFKKRPRKHSKKLNGHRQQLSQIQIENIQKS